MKKNIKQILNDIYLIDPSLKSKEGVLVRIIQDLLTVRPQGKIDEKFVNNLRLKLNEERSKLTELKQANKNMFKIFSKDFIYAGAAVLSLIALVAFLNLPNQAGESSIKDVGVEAFGELVLNPSQNEAAGDSSAQTLSQPDKVASSPAVPLGLGGGFGGGGVPSSAIAPYPYEITNYKYVYVGGDLGLASGQGNVYRRTVGSVGGQLADVIGRMDLNMVDLNKFQ
ncbi:MAG: hypothetical protein PHQ42_04995, partial [Patescibacteria group bacterium]|nr:hypothetical protein [Patescibacteria group bacterium]